MAVDSTKLVIPGQGHIYVAAVGSTKPTGTGVPSSPWTEIGHTSFDSPFTINRDGGESTSLPTWQASVARTSLSPLTLSIDFGLLQFDEASMQLYYGGGSVTSGVFAVPKTATPQNQALHVRVVDGSLITVFYFSKVAIIGSDSIEMDPEALTSMPVTATILDDSAVPASLFTVSVPA